MVNNSKSIQSGGNDDYYRDLQHYVGVKRKGNGVWGKEYVDKEDGDLKAIRSYDLNVRLKQIRLLSKPNVHAATKKASRPKSP